MSECEYQKDEYCHNNYDKWINVIYCMKDNCSLYIKPYTITEYKNVTLVEPKSRRYGQYEMVNGSIVNGLLDEIEELKNCLHLVVEETGHREAAMLLLTLTTRTENTP